MAAGHNGTASVRVISNGERRVAGRGGSGMSRWRPTLPTGGSRDPVGPLLGQAESQVPVRHVRMLVSPFP